MMLRPGRAASPSPDSPARETLLRQHSPKCRHAPGARFCSASAQQGERTASGPERTSAPLPAAARISSAMLVLYRLLAGGHYIVAARRGALQCVNHVLRSLPCFVVAEVLRHVVKIFLFLGQRRFKDSFGPLDQRPSSLDFHATRIIHNPLLPGRRFPGAPFNKSLVESDLKRTNLRKPAKDSAGRGRIFMKTTAEYRAMAEECCKWAREAKANAVRVSLQELAQVWLDAASKLDGLPATPTEPMPDEPSKTAGSADLMLTKDEAKLPDLLRTTSPKTAS